MHGTESLTLVALGVIVAGFNSLLEMLGNTNDAAVPATVVFQFSIGDAHVATTAEDFYECAPVSILYWRCQRLRQRRSVKEKI